MNFEQDKNSQRIRFRDLRDKFVQNLGKGDRSLAFSRIPSPMASKLSSQTILAGYIAKDSEVDPSALLREARLKGCRIALPHVTSRSSPMRFLLWQDDDELVPGPFGLMQPCHNATPCKPDVILVPLVAFDHNMMRLGQGAGHYDRALSLLDNIFTIGLAWSVQKSPALITDAWDIPMDAILTEQSWISL